jgi:hypothetical protein
MQKLKSTTLSSSNLKNQKHGGLQDLDSPIPVSIEDAYPDSNVTISILPTGGPKTETQIRNEAFWKLILETK